ncbi:hypothetical protein KC19_2G230900 [Ceratodon purpureus]|uniref:Uncharacterized protein n=1 Tax=Ceratodon purpureus TaxID=3225 RepID=A0A8T0IYC4_CERPU|nr:hypothetical protein KC19_2G230900 [Ceratodon purpureus]
MAESLYNLVSWSPYTPSIATIANIEQPRNNYTLLIFEGIGIYLQSSPYFFFKPSSRLLIDVEFLDNKSNISFIFGFAIGSHWQYHFNNSHIQPSTYSGISGQRS